VPTYLTRRRGAWWCRFRYTDEHGRARFHASPTPYRKDTDSLKAQRWAAQYRFDWLRQRTERIAARPPGAPTPLGVLCDAYLSDKRERGRLVDVERTMLERIKRDLGADTPADTIRPDRVARWRTALLASESGRKPTGTNTPAPRLSPRTVNAYLALLAMVYRYGIRLGIVATNPAEPAKVGRLDHTAPLATPLTVTQVEALLAECERLRTPIAGLVVVIYCTLGRTKDVKALRWEHLDLEAARTPPTVTYPNSKNRRIIGALTIPLRARAYAWLSRASADRAGPYVFGGTRPAGDCRKAWRSLIRTTNARLERNHPGAAKIPESYRLYDLRHTGASHLAQTGHLSALEITRMMGDTSVRTVERRYFAADNDRLAERLATLDAPSMVSPPVSQPRAKPRRQASNPRITSER